MSDDKVITIYRVSEARTCIVHNDPNTVILKITAGGEPTHYMFDLSDFARFAKQLYADAALLSNDVPPLASSPSTC